MHPCPLMHKFDNKKHVGTKCAYMCDKQNISPISTSIVLLIINMKILSNFEKSLFTRKNC